MGENHSGSDGILPEDPLARFFLAFDHDAVALVAEVLVLAVALFVLEGAFVPAVSVEPLLVDLPAQATDGSTIMGCHSNDSNNERVSEKPIGVTQPPNGGTGPPSRLPYEEAMAAFTQCRHVAAALVVAEVAALT